MKKQVEKFGPKKEATDAKCNPDWTVSVQSCISNSLSLSQLPFPNLHASRRVDMRL